MFHGKLLAKPVILDDWRENMQLMSAIPDATVTSDQLVWPFRRGTEEPHGNGTYRSDALALTWRFCSAPHRGGASIPSRPGTPVFLA